MGRQISPRPAPSKDQCVLDTSELTLMSLVVWVMMVSSLSSNVSPGPWFKCWLPILWKGELLTLTSLLSSHFVDDEPGGRTAEEPCTRHRVSAGLWPPHCLGSGPAAPESYLGCYPQLPRGVPQLVAAECAAGGPAQPQARGLR